MHDRQPQRPKKIVLHLLHPNVKPRKVNDACHVGFDKFDAADVGEDGGHGG
jgi:hypothetical protein